MRTTLSYIQETYAVHAHSFLLPTSCFSALWPGENIIQSNKVISTLVQLSLLSKRLLIDDLPLHGANELQKARRADLKFRGVLTPEL